MEILIFIILLLFIITLSYITALNRLKRLSVKVEESFSGIDIALAKRYDVLTKMIEVVKGYAKHEKETIFKVIKLRNDMTMDEKKEAYDAMNKGFEKINVLAENYPKLKANENFIILQKTIADVEEHLQAARRLYNSNISLYNQKVITFPSNIIAKINGYTKKDFFEAEEIERNNVNASI